MYVLKCLASIDGQRREWNGRQRESSGHHLVIGAEDGQSWKPELFYLDQPYVGCNWASTKFKFNHFSSGAWKLNNGLQYVSQYKYRAFNQLFSSHNCLFPTIDLCSISWLSPMTFANCADDQMTHHWFSRNTARDGQSFHNHHERTWHPSFHHQPKVHICSPLSHVKALSSITRALTHCHAN